MQTYHANAIPPMVEAFGTKHVTYAVGKLDTLNNVMNGTIVGGCGSDYGYDNDLDALCQSELQGYCRLQRTVAWFEYVKEFFPAPLRLRRGPPSAAAGRLHYGYTRAGCCSRAR